MKSFLLVILCIQVVSFSALALEKISEPKVVQAIQIAKDGKIAGVKTTILFKAWSQGCTAQEHFTLDIQVKNSEQLVTVNRNVPDICEGVAMLKDIQLTTSSLEISDVAGKPIKFVNPSVVDFTWEQQK